MRFHQSSRNRACILFLAVIATMTGIASCCQLTKRRMLENGLPAQSDFSSHAKTIKSILGLSKPNAKPAEDPFYGLDATPEELSKYDAGTILRKRPIYLTAFPGFNANEIIGWQMAFVTTSPNGEKQNMVATVAIPPNAGKRDKIVVQSPKASGAQPNCRTSYFLREGSGSLTGSSSEQIFMGTFLDRGYIVVLTDAQGQHDAFGSGPVAGRAVLDTIRATLSFSELKLAPRESVRVVPWGYSAGGLATLFASTLIQSYAPEISPNIAGWSMGGAPFNLRQTADSVNRGIGAGLILGVMRGLSNISPDLSKWADEHLNDKGKEEYQKTKDGCFFTFMPPNVDADVLGTNANDNKPGHYGYFTIPNALDEPIPSKVIRENSLDEVLQTDSGPAVPKAPMLVYCSIKDYVVPIGDVDALMQKMADQGAAIAYRRMKFWLHVTGVFAYQSENVEWISDRLEGKPSGLVAGQLSQQDVDTAMDDDKTKNVLGQSRTEELKKIADQKDNDKSDPWFS